MIGREPYNLGPLGSELSPIDAVSPIDVARSEVAVPARQSLAGRICLQSVVLVLERTV
jgi:hypothetical protein